MNENASIRSSLERLKEYMYREIRELKGRILEEDLYESEKLLDDGMYKINAEKELIEKSEYEKREKYKKHMKARRRHYRQYRFKFNM